MAEIARPGLRRLWFQFHKWIGIILVILLVPLGLTGSALVWHDALDEAINPARYAVSAKAGELPPSAYVAAAQARLGAGDRIGNLRYPEEGGPVVVNAVRAGQAGGAPRRGPPQRVSLWLDPADARVLDVADGNAGLVRWLHNFHGSLTVPGVGRQIVGWLGVAMLISSLTGLWLWWPTTGSWTRGFRWRRGNDVETNLHHQIGFWIALPLAMLSLTGAWISFPAFFGAISGSPQQARGGGGGDRFRATPLAPTQRNVDAALAAAAAEATGQPVSIAWPTDAMPAWRISFARDGGRPAEITVDDETGEIDRGRDSRGGGNGALRLVRQLHDGTGMGLAWQLIIFLGGIAPAVLGITGIIMWLRTRGWRAGVARRKQTRRSSAG